MKTAAMTTEWKAETKVRVTYTTSCWIQTQVTYDVGEFVPNDISVMNKWKRPVIALATKIETI